MALNVRTHTGIVHAARNGVPACKGSRGAMHYGIPTDAPVTCKVCARAAAKPATTTPKPAPVAKPKAPVVESVKLAATVNGVMIVRQQDADGVFWTLHQGGAAQFVAMTLKDALRAAE